MDCKRVGKLIYSLRKRKEKGMTQLQLAETLNVSDKTISKWERGLGCPDVSLLSQLSDMLDVNVESILSGNLYANEFDGGNMKKLRFYVCGNCNNFLASTGEAEVTCCGRKIAQSLPKLFNDDHKIDIETIEDDYYITIDHEMTRQHYIGFVAYVSYDRVLFIRLYPEQNPEVRFPKTRNGKLYVYCNQHGLMEMNKP